MKKRTISLLLALLVCFTLIPSAVMAAEPVTKLSVKIPGCTAVFTLENASAEYGLLKADVPEYIIALPGLSGKVICDTKAAVDLYGEFIADDPAKSNAGGGMPIMEAGWSRGYDFADDGPGKGITLVSVFVVKDGSLSLAEDYGDIGEEIVSKITFVFGYPIPYGYNITQLPENMIKSEAELRLISELAVSGTSAEPPVAATDIPSSWAVVQVNTAIAANLVPASLQSKYTQATTRAEFCALAVALYENVKGEITERTKFNDTTDINVEKAAAIGVTSGTGNNNFSPDSSLTREQAATMLSRLADATGKPLPKQTTTFNDVSDISSWATEAVGQMQGSGIMGGVGNNTFSPKAPYTREQSIVTIMRLWDVLPELSEVVSDSNFQEADAKFLSKDICDEIIVYANSLGYTSDAYPAPYGYQMFFEVPNKSPLCISMALFEGQYDYWHCSIGTGFELIGGDGGPRESLNLYSVNDMKAVLNRYAELSITNPEPEVPESDKSLSEISLPETTAVVGAANPANSFDKVHAIIKTYAEQLGYSVSWSGASPAENGAYDSDIILENGNYAVYLRYYYAGGTSDVRWIYRVKDHTTDTTAEYNHDWSCLISDIQDVIRKYSD
ncbi:MAG: S-layer homology domain-containing protein [Clostridiales bacterium]|nr:S-layer homology domain-containing protein [Clostridiales bacterium]